MASFGESPLLIELRRTSEEALEKRRIEDEARIKRAAEEYREIFEKTVQVMIRELPSTLREIALLGGRRCCLVDWGDDALIVAKECYLDLVHTLQTEFPGFKIGIERVENRNLLYMEW